MVQDLEDTFLTSRKRPLLPRECHISFFSCVATLRQGALALGLEALVVIHPLPQLLVLGDGVLDVDCLSLVSLVGRRRICLNSIRQVGNCR